MKKISWFPLFLLMPLLYVLACKKTSPTESSITYKVHPNPVDSVLIIESQPVSQTLNWQLADAVGRQVTQGQVMGGRYEMNTRTLKSGTYVLTLSRQDNAKDKVTTKIVILH